MSEKKYFLPKSIFILLVFSSALYSQQAGWFDRFFPKKAPSELTQPSINPPKSLVEPHPDALALQESFAQVVTAVQPAVVNISAVQITRVQSNPHEFYYGDPEEFFRRFFEGPQRSQPQREYRTEGTGSGVIIDPNGYILTNNHVVQGANELTVTLSDEKKYKGKVVGTDPRSDLAVIRIKGSDPFPYAPLGDSSQMRVGDFVLAMGSPFGLEKTVTSGIISAIRQSLNIEGKVFRNLIQTDAAINRGNSGGALVNLRGQVIGINTAIYAPTGVFSGIGFAIPVNEAKKILKDLIEKGYVERSWMGVEIADVDEVIARQFGLKTAEGALVNQVVLDSPAGNAGIKRGDIIVEFDGKKVPNIQTLQDTVSGTPPNKKVKVRVIREGESLLLDLKTAVMPGQSEAQNNYSSEGEEKQEGVTEWLGGRFSNINSRLRRGYSLEEGRIEGIVAIEVPSDSLASEAGIREGDVIQAVNRKKIREIADLEKFKKEIDPAKGLVFDVVRQGKSFYLSFKSVP